LRRAIAYQLNEVPLTPAPRNPDKDEVLEEEYYLFRSHLICHSDNEGFYLPIDFDEPLYADESLRVPGGIVGSSFAAMRELRAVAPLLHIELLAGALPKPKPRE
jgi:hypothetical protein